MTYFQDEILMIRSMMEQDPEKFVEAFKKQGWDKPLELYKRYFVQQSRKELYVLVAEVNQQVAGYVILLPFAKSGPFAAMNVPEIADLNVLMSYQKSGIGNKLMDVTEALAKEKSNAVSLAVGLHSGYGTAQRMYVKRGYLPEGSGVWYKGEPLEQYAKCENDDDLVLYFIKKL
ncbi:GNAT family N-acetyltransferase [Jeotgalibacillus aurantiacus]|uniref:GNAT family N-acetyltransferase n=1 Tax=Jeotgalibacillus aurantiacus TaxID=2763266 RepID=UPI001D0B10AF|nr:GNAT family N-acetyltransferase [Jeotgalibacillus aurantiacus]